jgi:plasmid stabilization system protein ParE
VKVTFSPSAKAYVAREGAYLRERNRAAGDRFRQNVTQFVRALAQFPLMGQEAADLPVRNARRFVLGEYIIHYELGESALVILTIRHGRERPPELPLDDDTDFELP